MDKYSTAPPRPHPPFTDYTVWDKCLFSEQMNLQTYVWPKNLPNMCTNENICLEKLEYLNIFEYLQCKSSKIQWTNVWLYP